ncbi:MAG: IS66 family transposase [Pseudomonadales bacterium]|nr:IS66 family transposase [Pseudomonadales bacterium]
MIFTSETLPNDLDQLKILVMDYQYQMLEYQEKVNWYEEQIKLLQRRQFGSSSERFNQADLFDEVEILAESEESEEPELDLPPKPRKKRGRKEPPAHLEHSKVVHTFPEDQQVCSCCGTALHVIGQECLKQLDYIPAKMRVIENIRLTYACHGCDEIIGTALMPPQPLPKSMATPGLLAWIAVSKYADHLPLYRQEAIFERLGVELSRATLARWMVKTGQLLKPLFTALQTELLSLKVIMADETPVQVLNEPGRDPQASSYMWCYRSGPLEAPIMLFQYQPGRASKYPEAFLNGFEGFLQTDGFSVYRKVCKSMTGINLVACMAHARRKFRDALALHPKKKGKPCAHSPPGRAAQALKIIKRLYKIEAEIKGNTAEERYRIRQEKSVPILNELKAWLDHQAGIVLPKTTLGRAIRYALNQWPYLIRYVEDGYLAIDNNATERAIKAFATGRKNWLFANSVAGVEASAIYYSLIVTAKANGLEPYSYLRYVLTELPKLEPEADITHLLPTHIKPEVLNTYQ